MASVVLGVFSNRTDAEDAISELEAERYNPKDISIMMRDTSEAGRVAEDTGAGEVMSSTLGGAAAGAVIGGLAGLVAAFAIPGLGTIFIGGPIATALGLTGAAATTASGVATGILAGGIIGALTSAFGLSREDARMYEDRIKEGGILIAVPTREGHEKEVKNIMSGFDADNIKVIESYGQPGRREEPEYAPAYASEIRHRGRRERGSWRRRSRKERV
ncbi:MAG: general stress protein [Patescibacteria group bacterium]|nr:general stress protein [Patescibacteria group bacterium]